VITVLGLPRQYSDADMVAFARADLVVGEQRYLNATRHLRTPRAREIVCAADPTPALDDIAAAAAPVVLAADGPGFSDVVRLLVERMGAGAVSARPASS
jgi:precorrin-6B methylase 1